MKMLRLVVALTFALTFGGAQAFDAAEQQTIDSLQQQIVLLQAQLAQLSGNTLTPDDVALLGWSVVACLVVGFAIRQIRNQL